MPKAASFHRLDAVCVTIAVQRPILRKVKDSMQVWQERHACAVNRLISDVEEELAQLCAVNFREVGYVFSPWRHSLRPGQPLRPMQTHGPHAITGINVSGKSMTR